MDDQTAFVLALQLIALCTVVSALILYLMCRIRKNHFTPFSDNDDLTYVNIGGGKGILVTSLDNMLGLQLAYHLATRGFRVFAGVKPSGYEADGQNVVIESESSIPKKILEAKWKKFEACCKKEENENFVGLVVLPLDVTREDLLHEALGTIRRHLPAGEDGLWAVINTAGSPCRGRLENQDSPYWDAVMKQNVTGTLKVAKTFLPLLRNKKGRLINVGAKVENCDDESQTLVADTASRYAVEGASAALRKEMKHLGIKVITFHPEGLPISRLFSSPTQSSIKTGADGYAEHDIAVLPPTSLEVIEEAVLSDPPKASYTLLKSPGFFRIKEKIVNLNKKIQIV
ncbi:short-chain dehydrogenase, putative [Pediculus humanus corporis]|uniref:Short-chain dehydrogenase, putative n=1 Tax=Pediculus humanus subsp. corporis TaxID=121224 RepID=E0VLD7_PEDHC|nr:short-chain dehydrogenase, putative [Pediculus humanus corporis]EEB14193.1 short-chain dehydrogenase, putative [Pediculus humanus corporis]